ncbi:hypothetical protein ACFE04_024091 [Oxalis oulophora]
MGHREVDGRLAECRRSLLTWSRSLSADVRGEIKKLELDISSMRGSLGLSCDQDNEYVDKLKRLRSLLDQEDMKWRQRSKVFWLQSGDINSHFFHLYASGHRHNNLINGLCDVNGQ